MSIALSTLGVAVGFAFSAEPTSTQTLEDVRPKGTGTTYTLLKDIKDVPDFNPAPDTIEVTPLINEEYKTYIHGLKDLGGDLAFLANFTQELFDLYNNTTTGIIDQAKSKLMWLQIDHPKLDKSLFINVSPAPLGLNAMSVNSAMEVTLHFAPLSEPVWADHVAFANDPRKSQQKAS